MTGYFITGTDTGIGKTWITAGLMAAMKKRSYKVAGMKPVASGCTYTKDGLRNDDALLIQSQADIKTEYEQVNPYAFAQPVAPHAAAAQAGVNIDLDKIIESFNALAAEADIVIVEGVGGWRVPINDRQTVGDIVSLLDLPVIMVVGLRLGCINHALLTAEAIQRDGLKLAGWVANQLEPDYAMLDATLTHLSANITAPVLGHLPHMDSCQPDRIAGFLDIDLFWE